VQTFDGRCDLLCLDVPKTEAAFAVSRPQRMTLNEILFRPTAQQG
jgi:hypothetical protein